jgi:DNA-binding beta-propeller fold protein YncE
MYLQRLKRHTAILATSLSLSVSSFVGIPTAYAQTAAWESTADLSQPESVVYDSATNLLYVSNAATDATTGDPAGYISTVDPATGKVVTKEWLTGLGDIKGCCPWHQFICGCQS